MASAVFHLSRPWRYAATGVAAAGLLIAGGWWLIASDGGLQAATMLAERFSGGRLQIDQAEDRLLGPLRIGRLHWHDDGVDVIAEQLDLDLQAGEFLAGRAHFTRLTMARLTLEQTPSPQPPSRPATLRLPLDLRIDRAELGELRRNGAVLATTLAATITSENDRHRLDDLRADVAGLAVGAHGEIAADAPFALDAGGWLQGKVEDRPLRLDVTATGTLDAIALAAISREASLQGEARATLTPFAALPIARLHVDLTGLDPAAWRTGAPAAALDLATDLRATDDAGLVGEFSLRNRTPGPLDRQRLPVATLGGQLRWQSGRIDLSELDAALAGSGRLRGNGVWQANELALDLRAEAVDASALHSALRRSRLAGPLKLHLGGAQQSVRFDLADARYALKGQVTRRGDEIRADELLARADDAVLKADGHADGEGAFALRGELMHFDPTRFVDLPGLPPARINADFEAQGRWRPAIQAKGRFALKDSSLAKRPLAGRGEIDLDGRHLRRLDLHLTAGANRFDAQGAFGSGESLTATLAAPELAPYGLGGNLDGSLRLSGTATAPVFDLRVASERFSVPGYLALKGLELDAKAGAGDTGPLSLRLRLATGGSASRPEALQDLTAGIDGTRMDHTISAATRLAGRGRLNLAAHGGLATGTASPAWRGELTAFDARSNDAERNLHLVQATPLRLAADGWTLGPAQLAGDDWQGRLEAHADRSRLALAIDAAGPRLGRLTATMAVGADGPWHLARAAPWQAALDIDSSDLAWLGPLIGGDAATSGRARVALQLSGTPERPLASGRIHGEALALRLPELGLHLENGQLDAALADNRLRLTHLDFDSLLPAPPRALVIAEGDAVTALTTRPGRVEAAGEVAVDGGQLFLDVRFDRLGIAPGPDRWLALSGSGRLDWRDGRLGLAAQVTADAGYWQMPRLDAPRLGDDVVVKRRGEPAPTTPSSPLALDVEVGLGRHFRFSGSGLDARLAGKVRLTAAGRDLPRATGTIRAMDGRFDAYGQRLHIERGILTFSGLIDNPALDVLAVRQNLPVTPGVEVTGTVRRPQVRLVSDPDMPDAEKLSWLVLGRAPDQAGADDTSLLLAAADSLLGGESGGVVQQLKRNFGIEDLGVRTGQFGDRGRTAGSQVVGNGSADNGTGTQIFSVGKRLSANTLLSYEQALGTTQSLVKLTLTLSRRLSVVGRAGADNAIDLFYTFTFGR